jgi:FkbM family methyltransferase
MYRVVKSKYANTDTEIFVYNNGEHISDNMINTKNFFEVRFLDYIAKKYNNQSGILDIGANIGNHSLFFAKFLNCEMVYSFEPFSSNIELLKKNMSLFENKSKIYQIALSDQEGVMPLYNSQASNFGGYSLHSYSNGSSFIVNPSIKVITLDSLNLNNISMIKIDVENHENEVLEGAKETILRNKPIIFIENLFHGHPDVCPNPNPHKVMFDKLNYKRIDTNIQNSYMDLWIPNTPK